MASGTKATVLRIAADMLGGRRKLRAFLGVPSASVASWLTGNEEPPEEAFLQALRLILDDLDAGGGDFSRALRAHQERARDIEPR